MKTTRKFLALALAVFMMLALAVPAFAEDESQGSITIQNATVGKEYAAYKIFDATYSGENVSYYINSSSVWYPTVASSGLFALNKTGDEGVYNVVPSNGITSTAILDLFKSQFTYDAASATWTCAVDNQPADSKKASTGTVVLNIPYGYYFVTSTLKAVLSVNTAAPNVTIIDKNQGPTWDNEPVNSEGIVESGAVKPGKVIVLEDGTRVSSSSNNYGETVKFSIAINATAFDGESLITYYYIKDELSKGFTYNNDMQVTVTYIPSGATEPTSSALVPSSGTGRNTYTEVTSTGTDSSSIFELTIPFGLQYGSNAKIEVTYSATVNSDDSVVLGTMGNPNTAWFTYTKDSTYDPEDPEYPADDPEDPDYPNPDNPDDPTDDDSDNPGTTDPFDDSNKKETKTYVYAIGVNKIDNQSKPLSGANFKLVDSNGIELFFVGSNGIYSISSSANAVKELAVDSNGILAIKGLAEGTYSLIETKAPDGYNLLTAAIPVTITYTDAQSDVDYGCTVACAIPVENNKGEELPATGGIGTTLFITFGMIAMLGAGVFLVTNKRMAKESF